MFRGKHEELKNCQEYDIINWHGFKNILFKNKFHRIKIFRNLLANITILMADNILVSVILMKWSGVDVATHILTDNKYNCYFTLSVIINIIPLQQHLQLKHCFYWKRFTQKH